MNKYKPASFSFKCSEQQTLQIHVQENGKVFTDFDGEICPLIIGDPTGPNYHIIIDDYMYLNTRPGELNSNIWEFLKDLLKAYVKTITHKPQHPVEVF